ncbi:MAG: hypothetical protein U9R02_16465 [Thermodesulfobacteriota bacterium]|nr:hypothetical protein [Thermodesulfobacteriota bacterium]
MRRLLRSKITTYPSFVLQNIIVVRTIGIAGGLLLIYFGLSIIKKVRRGNIQTGFLNSYDGQNHEPAPFENKGLDNPVVGGIMVSMGTDWILPI